MEQLFGKNSERVRNELSSGTLRKDFRKLRNELLGRSEMNRKSSERFRKQSSHRIRKATESVLFPKPFLSFRQGGGGGEDLQRLLRGRTSTECQLISELSNREDLSCTALTIQKLFSHARLFRKLFKINS